MKKIILFLTVISLSLTSKSQIVNPNFENWSSYTGTNSIGLPYGGIKFNGWDSSDSLTQYYMGGSSVGISLNPAFGALSARLVTTNITIPFSGLNLPVTGVPGVLTNGKIFANLSSTTPSITIRGGTPDTSRSSTFRGYYKFTPATSTSNDSARITVIKLRNPTGSSTPDTVGMGVGFIYMSYPFYTDFTVRISYRDFFNQPDTTLIIITSGYLPPTPTLSNPYATAGTELLIDSLSFSGYVPLSAMVGVSSPEFKSLNVYPIPASNYLNVYLPDNHNLSMEVTDLYGKKMFSSPYTDKMDISSLSSGLYFLNIKDENDNIMGFRKFLVNNQ